jgi:hypothetical protein
MPRTADYTLNQPFGPLLTYQSTIQDICLNDQAMVNGSPIAFGTNHLLGWSTNLPVQMARGQSPFLVTGPGQRRGMHIDGTPIQELGGGRRSNVVGKIYDFMVDVLYVHDVSTMEVDNASIENAKGIFEDVFQQYTLLKDSGNVPLPGHIAMEAIDFHTVIFQPARNYAACRFTVRAYLQQYETPVGAPF